MKGESLYKISKIMGNSPQVCQKHYAALMPESLYESVEFEKGETAEKQLKEPVNQIIDVNINDKKDVRRLELRLVVNNR